MYARQKEQGFALGHRRGYPPKVGNIDTIGNNRHGLFQANIANFLQFLVTGRMQAIRTFKRRFRAATGFSPVGYVQTLRIEEAKQIPGIEDITITVAAGRHVEMIPEGDRYLGFVFAGGTDPQSVEDSLRRAANELSVTIDGEDVRPPTTLV